ncbi:hypothetical protein BS50DRAFT_650372 [Corynespora cassiicola Philippines]|uniref:Ribonuclease P/MRP protein subunit POP5 n=1 Tax=Corynespora cassiicola Philippines TaxID=1448308 RepID=A0A2T2N9C5_CORCC|nr:hypothetical protein BS50DRAFT_650372 [Corynespora cassiicola Philippines]
MVRVKNRYLVVNLLYPTSSTASNSKDALPELVQFHAPTPDAFHTGQLMRVIRDGINELFGEYGMGMAGTSLKVNYWSPATSTAIIRCPREHYQMVWAALTFITRLPRPVDAPVVVRVVRVSGTIKKAEEEVIRRAKMIIRRAKTSDGQAKDDVLQGVFKAVEKRREAEDSVLARVDQDDESESESD